jgi:hypothetical protein
VKQTLAIFLDAYRELNARKMFWITLILTGLVLAFFAMWAPDGNQMTFLAMKWNQPHARTWYEANLLQKGVTSWWLGWGAGAMALISTTFIFPEFVSGGAIDLYLSKPITRLRLFITKYIAALMFVMGQALVFSIGAFLIVGIRIGEWKWGLFLAIPLVTILFSFLFSFCVLMGLWTRSSIAALILTLLLWLVIGIVDFFERPILTVQTMSEARMELQQARADKAQEELQHPPASPTTGPSTEPFVGITSRRMPPKERRDDALRQVSEARSQAEMIGKWHTGLFITKTILPKPSETIEIMNLVLFAEQELSDLDAATLRHRMGQYEDEDFSLSGQAMIEGELRARRMIRQRSVAWVLGTSLLFELCMLGLAAHSFCRRDY